MGVATVCACAWAQCAQIGRKIQICSYGTRMEQEPTESSVTDRN